MDIKPIRTDKNYRRALKEIEALMDVEDESPEADRMEVLAILVEGYEDERWRIEPPDPVSGIKHMLELRGLPRAVLVPILGSRARVSEILNRRRRLTLPMIWRLVRELGVPAEILVKPYALARKKTQGRKAAAARNRPARWSKRQSG